MISLVRKHLSKLQVLLLLVVCAFMAIRNTDASAFYTGWDNIHAELNLGQYAQRVFFGAWQEHEGLGSPTAKAQQAEVFRLPILFLFQLILPDHFHRFAFIFLMHAIGGVSMYYYLSTIWLKKSNTIFRSWIATVSSLFYLLHVLTLQQFYISFEMFTVQFAFFPLLLLIIHRLVQKPTYTKMMLFVLVQIAIAPSAHTPTVFYLGVVFSVIYAFFVSLATHKNAAVATRNALLIGLATAFLHSYWIIPNLFYTFYNSAYVAESKANILFGPESLWSIREASTTHSFLTGLHYLLTWKDYSFESRSHVYIFDEWKKHLESSTVIMQMYTLAIFSLLGVVSIIFDKSRTINRWAILIPYLICISFIWLGLFPSQYLLLPLFNISAVLEAFRNPFTKLSILYTFFLIVAFASFLETTIEILRKIVPVSPAKMVSTLLLTLTTTYIFSIASPSFSGNFISDKLIAQHPPAYQELFDYMKTRNKYERVLEMPYTSHEGWVLHDWSTPTKKQGYQGIGFVFFGIPQSYLTPDFARWNAANDYFYQELQYAVNTKNAQLFSTVVEKYSVPLVILDESRINPHKPHVFSQTQQLLTTAGYTKVWQHEFLAVFEKQLPQRTDGLLIPQNFSFTDQRVERVKEDTRYSAQGPYILEPAINYTKFFYPFAHLYLDDIPLAAYSENISMLTGTTPPGDYIITIPGLSGETIETTMALKRIENTIEIIFPHYTLVAGDTRIELPQLQNQTIALHADKSDLVINGKHFAVPQNSVAHISVSLSRDVPLQFSDPDGIQLTEYLPDWTTLQKTTTAPFTVIDTVGLEIAFPIATANLQQRPSENCSSEKDTSTILTTFDTKGAATYTADKFGVNCNSLPLEFMTPASSYLLRIKGENKTGRSSKFFVDYSGQDVVHDEYLLPESSFDKTYGLHKISTDVLAQFFVNWETRSFGKISENRIDTIQLIPLPIERFSQVTLERRALSSHYGNPITISDSKDYFNFIYSVTFACESSCWIGLNQSYDRWWIAVDGSFFQRLPHTVFNNWANMWQVTNKQTKMHIVFMPQLLSLAALGTAIFGVGWLATQTITQRKTEKSLKKKRARTVHMIPKRTLLGFKRQTK